MKRLLLSACLVAGFLSFSRPAAADTFSMILQGKVVMEDGSVPPKPVGIERTCSDDNQGSAPGPPTNKKGEYVWRMDIDPTQTRVCKLRAVLAGYTSNYLDITEHFNNRYANPNLAPLVLTATVQDPRVIVITNEGVPTKSLRPWKAAMKALDDRNFAEAVTQLQAALSASPKFAQGWNTLGLVYGQQSAYDKGRDAFQHAIEADPKLLPPYVSLDRLCVRTKDWQCVTKVSGDLLKADVKKMYASEAYLHQAVAQLESKDISAAESSIQESLRLDPAHKNPRAEYVLGRVLEAKGDASGAKQHINRYLELAPTALDGDQIRARLQILGTPSANAGEQPALELP
jgi:Tfp pilus assembly protein PilF